jgi:hypothetical protein
MPSFNPGCSSNLLLGVLYEAKVKPYVETVSVSRVRLSISL